MSLPLSIPLLPRNHGSLNIFPESPRESPAALNDRCRRFSSDSEVVQESPRESLFKDSYFVSGRGIDISSGIAERFKKQTQHP